VSRSAHGRSRHRRAAAAAARARRERELERYDLREHEQLERAAYDWTDPDPHDPVVRASRRTLRQDRIARHLRRHQLEQRIAACLRGLLAGAISITVFRRRRSALIVIRYVNCQQTIELREP
jgi:hypothetical protein